MNHKIDGRSHFDPEEIEHDYALKMRLAKAIITIKYVHNSTQALVTHMLQEFFIFFNSAIEIVKVRFLNYY